MKNHWLEEGRRTRTGCTIIRINVSKQQNFLITPNLIQQLSFVVSAGEEEVEGRSILSCLSSATSTLNDSVDIPSATDDKRDLSTQSEEHKCVSNQLIYRRRVSPEWSEEEEVLKWNQQGNLLCLVLSFPRGKASSWQRDGMKMKMPPTYARNILNWFTRQFSIIIKLTRLLLNTRVDK